MPKPIQIALNPSGLGALFVLLDNGVIYKSEDDLDTDGIKWSVIEGPWEITDTPTPKPNPLTTAVPPLSLFENIARRLSGWGFTAMVEHPGWIHVWSKDSLSEFAAGIDEEWGILVIDAQGDEGPAENLGFARSSEDVTKIAEAIAAYVERPL